MRVKALLLTCGDLLCSSIRQPEVPDFVELRRADDSDGLWQHHLVGAVCVEVNAGQEGRLCGVSLGEKKQQKKQHKQ